MRVLVSGAAGFVGGYITAELMARGHEVVGIDDFSRYGNSDVEVDYPLYRGNAADVGILFKHLRDCDHFIAAAAMCGGIEFFHAVPFDILANNNAIIAAACRASVIARECGMPLKKTTFLSSSMVFESAESWPSREGDELVMPPPRSSYGLQKLCTEYYARAAWEQHRLPYTILRPFNCVGVGEGSKMTHVFPDLARKILSGQDPLEIYGDGLQVRHYTYGVDLARGIADSLECDGALNEDFNLSSSRGASVLEVARLMWTKVNGDKPFRYVSREPFPHDVRRRVPDIKKAESVLGWKAPASLGKMASIVLSHVAAELKPQGVS